MTYLTLSLWFVGAALLATALLPLASRTRPRPRPHLGAVLLTIGTLFVLTAVFDNIMIGTGLFHYAPSQLVGVHIGLAPLEDFTYPLAGALLLPALWTLLVHRRGTHSSASAGRTGTQERT
ncbi:MAG: lycopene cyclase domain-containing protein [Actinomycetota bacterium]